MASKSYIALLRGINVGTSPRVPMDRLRVLCENIGWQDVRTYIQSGNIIFRSTADGPTLEDQLQSAMPQVFGVAPTVIVRDSVEWAQIADRNPFTDEGRQAPNLVMLAVSKLPPVPGALEALQARAGTERLERIGDAIWIFFADGAGRSKITPAVLERAAGSPVTTRNLNTVLRIAELQRHEG